MSAGAEAAAATDRSDSEKNLINDTLAGQFRLLRFPEPLEGDFVATYARRSVAVVRRVLPWITLLYALSAAVMYGAATPDTFTLWANNAMWPVTAVLAWLWLLVATRWLDRAMHLHVGIAITATLFVTVRSVFLLGDDPAAVYVTYQTIYLLFIAFTITRLRFYAAIAWATAAGALAIITSVAEQLEPNWLAFAQYYMASALISAVIGYVMEYRDRADWLKSRQMELEKRELDALRTRADAYSRRQQVVADYLERVGGNLTATEIAGRTLSFLVEHSGAQVGVVFLATGDRLRRAASWGLEGETSAPDDLGRGETLIGQVAENRRNLRLTHLPADYHVIRTATGAAAPAELLVLPVCHQQQTLAVIELAALAPFADAKVELVERIVVAMAGTLVSAQAREALARVDIDDFNL